MKKSILFSSVSVLVLMVHVQAGELVLRYDAPANDTMTEALPVGNGMLGGMIHGKPEFERMVLNEISLWTGDEKTATGGYDEMGSYQTLGILNIDTLAKSGAGEAKVPMVVCASGQESFYQHESIEASTDNNPGTKWCVVPDGVPLIWELRLPEARAISQYTFTSAGDVQERDPSTWTFSGSNNGKEWTLLDNHTNALPMEKRCETKTFTCANDKAFKSYRLTFAPKKGVMHFQIAEISIPGVIFPGKAAQQKVENYSRALDLSRATHRVTYKAGDVTYCRETFASKPDQVMVMRLTADKPKSCGGAVLLKGGHGDGEEIEDLLLLAGDPQPIHFRHPRLATRHTHGTGCSLSSAIAAGLAHGLPLSSAVQDAIAWLQGAIAHAWPLGAGQGPVHHFWQLWSKSQEEI